MVPEPTVMVVVAVDVQPPEVVPVAVYKVVAVGVAVTIAPDAACKPATGDQEIVAGGEVLKLIFQFSIALWLPELLLCTFSVHTPFGSVPIRLLRPFKRGR